MDHLVLEAGSRKRALRPAASWIGDVTRPCVHVYSIGYRLLAIEWPAFESRLPTQGGPLAHAVTNLGRECHFFQRKESLVDCPLGAAFWDYLFFICQSVNFIHFFVIHPSANGPPCVRSRLSKVLKLFLTGVACTLQAAGSENRGGQHALPRFRAMHSLRDCSRQSPRGTGGGSSRTRRSPARGRRSGGLLREELHPRKKNTAQVERDLAAW